MLEFFANFFGNPFNLVMILLFIFIGIFIGLLWKPRAHNQVMKLIPRDRRFIDFKVVKENAFSVECEPIKGFPKQRFIKFASGFTGQVGKFLKRTITRYIGKEGTAYTYKTESAPIEIGSLAVALKGIWGEEFYKQIPKKRREELEAEKVNVIVDLEGGLTPPGYEPITEEDIWEEEDRKGAVTFWEGKRLADRGKLLDWIFIFVAGAGSSIMAFYLLGMLK